MYCHFLSNRASILFKVSLVYLYILLDLPWTIGGSILQPSNKNEMHDELPHDNQPEPGQMLPNLDTETDMHVESDDFVAAIYNRWFIGKIAANTREVSRFQLVVAKNIPTI
jgi:hypothetical protein